ncbi:DUF2635 domain-containing protein [Serratia odorifera]|uniref:Protein of uncharacterized function (DUF2635) n=1 Tax=Serratia odorifera TaxID=618 RepID=A0A3S4FH69_SEROD|nr:DUF2635 domain-containing protein [Serratia odorifera]PNK92711.1 DUF2635 domain-containing protein [Serratia odorifera]RII73898.1 DUF2635 domain-containing protein [Serratia odorifera]VDZ51497.1 Protein of uncharacterised function (DUF2635) [Serratia odorifera]
MFVKPAKGRSVPDPAQGDFLPESGRNVEVSQYWLRRRKVGDIEEATQSKTVVKSKPNDQGGENGQL